jgi:uncharacterized protein (TIGR01777 family)
MSKVLIAGGSGSIGRRLTDELVSVGHEVFWLSRTPDKFTHLKAFYWDPSSYEINSDALDVDVIINLAGAGIADKPWTKNRKRLIINSRVQSASTLFEALKNGDRKPELYIGASAIGYYGDRPDEKNLTERSESGLDFVSECCVKWEEATQKMAELGIPISILRIGIVLDKECGAFTKMALPLKFLSAPYFGNGEQYYSWIHVDDMVGIIRYVMESRLEGTFNAVSPNPCTNRDLMKSLSEAKNRASLTFGIPKSLLKLTMGEMHAILTNSSHISSQKLQGAGYVFSFKDIDSAMSELI